MPPITEPSARRGLVDQLAIGLLISAVVVSVGAVALLTVYMNRIGDAAEGLRRVDPLASYSGRPSAVGVDGVVAVNYLLMTTGADDDLDAVLIAHLSASRRNLTLIALPSDLLVDPVSGSTLAQSYAADPLVMAREVESLTQARMDHQVHLELTGFASVVDSLGGLDVDGGRLSGDDVVGHLTGVSDPTERSVRTANLLRAALARASMGSVITDPNRFDKILDALTPCLAVDAGLTADEIEATLVESRVHADEIVTWPLDTVRSGAGARAEPAELAALRTALASDDLAARAQARRAAQPAPAPTR